LAAIFNVPLGINLISSNLYDVFLGMALMGVLRGDCFLLVVQPLYLDYSVVGFELGRAVRGFRFFAKVGATGEMKGRCFFFIFLFIFASFKSFLKRGFGHSSVGFIIFPPPQGISSTSNPRVHLSRFSDKARHVLQFTFTLGFRFACVLSSTKNTPYGFFI